MTALAKRLKSFTSIPEFNVAIFALLLNLPWEFLQVPLYEGMSEAPHWNAVKSCLHLISKMVQPIIGGSRYELAADDHGRIPQEVRHGNESGPVPARTVDARVFRQLRGPGGL